MKNTFIWIIVIVIVVILGFSLFSGDNESLEQNVEENTENREEETEVKKESNIISYTDSGYSPGELNIKVGDTVTFKNESSSELWTASAMHPTHKSYPGSGIENCGVVDGIFDSCEGVGAGEEWSFTFDEIGTWGYHNHLQSSHFGKIIVE